MIATGRLPLPPSGSFDIPSVAVLSPGAGPGVSTRKRPRESSNVVSTCDHGIAPQQDVATIDQADDEVDTDDLVLVQLLSLLGHNVHVPVASSDNKRKINNRSRQRIQLKETLQKLLDEGLVWILLRTVQL
jgi:hypothetical protein